MGTHDLSLPPPNAELTTPFVHDVHPIAFAHCAAASRPTRPAHEEPLRRQAELAAREV